MLEGLRDHHLGVGDPGAIGLGGTRRELLLISAEQPRQLAHGARRVLAAEDVMPG